MPVKALENSLWGALAAFLLAILVAAIIGFFIYLSGSRTALSPLSAPGAAGIWFLALRALVFLTPFILISFPFWIDERFPVRGLFRFFFYPMVAAVAVLIALFLLGAGEFLRIKLEVMWNAGPGAPLPWSRAPLPILTLDLLLPDPGNRPLTLAVVSRLSDRLLKIYLSAKVWGLSPKVWVISFSALYTPLMVFVMRALPQGRAYQYTAAFAMAWTLSAIFYSLVAFR